MTDLVRTFIAGEIAAIPRETRIVQQASGYGVDLLCVDDITPRADDTAVDSLDSLKQDLYHRLITFEMIGDTADERDGWIDIVTFLHRGMTQRELLTVAGKVIEVLRKDDRVADVTVEASYVSGTLLIECVITPEDPSAREFSLIVAVAPDGTTKLETE